MKCLSFFAFMLVANVAMTQTTTLAFDLVVLGHTVGNLEVKKQVNGDQIIYTTESESVVNFFGENRVTTSQMVVFHNGEMTNSSHNVWKNGELYSAAKIVKENGVYQITRKGKSTTFSDPVNFCAIQLFFQKPKTTDCQIFVEPEGIFKPLVCTKLNSYKVKDAGGGGDQYFYNSSGKLQKIVIDIGFFNVYMIYKG